MKGTANPRGTKTTPDAAPEPNRAAGLHADRLSINVELPQDAGVRKLAPEKRPKTIRGATAGHLDLEIAPKLAWADADLVASVPYPAPDEWRSANPGAEGAGHGYRDTRAGQDRDSRFGTTSLAISDCIPPLVGFAPAAKLPKPAGTKLTT